ncbi:VanZ family protein [Kitasatospora sp. NPDC006697]|uniref:VanZ family protein n=1 Tax=Kitasatospora sp. NPDC006697 TaxID=3364020 RepID=UPI0036A9C565
MCSIGSASFTDAFNEQGWMNIALYVPLAFCGVWAFGRWEANLAAYVVLSAATEVTQTLAGTGRACDLADFLDNSAGAAVGVAAAIAWIVLHHRRMRANMRSALQGAVILGTGLAAVAAVFLASPIRIYSDVVMPSIPHPDIAVARQAAEKLFGPQVHVETTKLAPDPSVGPGPRLAVTTDAGSFQLLWPSQQLAEMASANLRADDGNLTASQMEAIGNQFISTWFPNGIGDAQRTASPAGKQGEARAISYRRHNADGVLMPLRLDVMISAGGRVMSARALLTPDPQLPHPTVSQEIAEQQAVRENPGSRATDAFLLAKQIGGQWRPCWFVSLSSSGQDQSSSPSVYIDGLSGAVVSA